MLYARLEQAGRLPPDLEDRYALLYPQMPLAVRLALLRDEAGSLPWISPWAWRCRWKGQRLP